MPKNHMPVAHFGVRPEGVRADVARPQDFDKWRPEIRARAGDGDGNALVIDVLGLIGETWDGTGVSDQKVGALLRGASDRDVIVNINSPGGDMFAGIAIYDLLRLHPGEVTVRVVGLAASAASIIAMAGDRVQIGRTAFLMIHNAWTIAAEDQHGFRSVADQLAVFDEALADLYSIRSSIPAADIALMMNSDTYISGRNAIERGFADELLPGDLIETVPNARAEIEGVKASAELAFIARKAGYTRSQERDLKNRLSAKPSAGDDGMPRAADSLNALNRSFTSFLGT